MDEVRKGQIALLVLKEKFRREGIRLESDYESKLRVVSEAIGVPYEEIREFFELIVRERVDEMFKK